MPKATKDPITSALNDVLKNDPPKSAVRVTLDALKGQEQSIRSAVEKGWTPLQLAKKFRAAGVKVSEDKLRMAIRDIAGIPVRTYGVKTFAEPVEAKSLSKLLCGAYPRS